MLRTLSLFAGIGGFDLGLERTGGFRTVAFCEVADFPRAILAKHWPEVPCYDDVRTLDAGRLQADGIEVDIICGGFPCQDVSVAGQREGIGGARSGLWGHFARLIGEIRPRIALVENVPGLLDRGIGTVLGDLAALGYDAEWHVVSAAQLGAPHGRERLWVVAYPEGQRAGQLRWGKRAQEGAAAWGVHWPECQPPSERVVDGVPHGVDRLTALGNGIVPAVAEFVGRAVLDALDGQARGA